MSLWHCEKLKCLILFLSHSRSYFLLRYNSYVSTSSSFSLTLSMCTCCTLPCLYSVSLYPNLHRSSSSTIRAPTHQHPRPHSPLPLRSWLRAQLSRWPGLRPNVMESSPNLQGPAHLGPSKTFSVWNRECQYAVHFCFNISSRDGEEQRLCPGSNKVSPNIVHLVWNMISSRFLYIHCSENGLLSTQS